MGALALRVYVLAGMWDLANLAPPLTCSVTLILWLLLESQFDVSFTARALFIWKVHLSHVLLLLSSGERVDLLCLDEYCRQSKRAERMIRWLVTFIRSHNSEEAWE